MKYNIQIILGTGKVVAVQCSIIQFSQVPDSVVFVVQVESRCRYIWNLKLRCCLLCSLPWSDFSTTDDNYYWELSCCIFRLVKFFCYWIPKCNIYWSPVLWLNEVKIFNFESVIVLLLKRLCVFTFHQQLWIWLVTEYCWIYSQL